MGESLVETKWQMDKKELARTVVTSNSIFADIYIRPEADLTLRQKQLIIFLVSRISKEDECFKLTEISIKEFCDIFNIYDKGIALKKKILRSLHEITTKQFTIEKDGKIQTFGWLANYSMIDLNTGQMYLQLNDYLKPYYLNLKKQYTIYQIGYTTQFSSKYSYTLYEWIKRNQKRKFWSIRVNEALKIWGFGQYKNITDLKRRIIMPAIKDINTWTDINVKVEYKKDKRIITDIVFYSTKKTGEQLKKVNNWIPIKKKEQLEKYAQKILTESKIEDVADDLAENAKKTYKKQKTTNEKIKAKPGNIDENTEDFV